MDEDQIIDEDLIKMRDRINHHNLSLRTGNVVLLSIQQKIQHLEKHHREIVARIDELEILRELRKRQEDDAV